MTAPPPDLAALRERVRRLEQSPGAAAAPTVPLGLAAIDRVLPGGGLARGAVHELLTPDAGDGAATAFLAVIAGRIAAAGVEGPVLWVSARDDLFPPGVLAYGWSPERLLRVRCQTVADVLWVMEDGLRCPGLAAVAGDVGDLDFAITRRLQLAAGEKGVPLLLHRPWRRALVPSAASTRWRVAGVPAPAERPDPVWSLDLVRCRGGRPGRWTVGFDCRTLALYETEAAPVGETEAPVEDDLAGDGLAEDGPATAGKPEERKTKRSGDRAPKSKPGGSAPRRRADAA